jgi:hypothetical protein
LHRITDVDKQNTNKRGDMKFTRLESLKLAVGVYEHDAETTKNPYRKADYTAIKKLYDGLSHFCDNEQHSCGAILPFLQVAVEKVDKK